MNLPRTPQSATGSFVASPRDVHFENQREHEQLYLLLRSHEVVNVPWIAVIFVMLLVPLFFGGLVTAAFPNFFDTVSPFYAFILFMFWNMLVLMYGFYRYLIWFFSAYIITDKRLVDVDFVGLFHKDYTETTIENVQDVTSKVTGPLSVLFNFGLVHVQTASERSEIEFENVPQPDVVTRIIGELIMEQGGALRGRSSSTAHS